MEHEGKRYSKRSVVLIAKDGTVAYRDAEYRLGDDADLKALLAAVAGL